MLDLFGLKLETTGINYHIFLFLMQFWNHTKILKVTVWWHGWENEDDIMANTIFRYVALGWFMILAKIENPNASHLFEILMGLVVQN